MTLTMEGNEEYSWVLPGEVQAIVRSKFFDTCYYDADFGRIFFSNPNEAMEAYVYLQFAEIRRYRSAKSELLGINVSEDEAAKEWIDNYAASFRSQWIRLVGLVTS